MTKQEEELIRKLTALSQCPWIAEVAIVEEVNEEDFTCKVKTLKDDTEILAVRLKAGIDGVNEGIIQIPKVGSSVVVVRINNNTQSRFIAALSEVDKVLTTCKQITITGGDNDVEISINEEGISITSENQKFLGNAIELGNGASEPALKGNAATQVLTNIVTQLNQLVTALNAFAGAQSTAAGAVPILAPLIPGWTALATAVSAITPALVQLNVDIPLTKSQKVKVG